jgi:hypothetical protein
VDEHDGEFRISGHDHFSLRLRLAFAGMYLPDLDIAG